MARLVRIGSKAEIGPGRCRAIEVEGKTLALYNVDGRFHATDNACLHQGGPLADGVLDGATIMCPWHGWQYDVTTGECLFNRAVRVATYRVRVEGDDVLVEL